MTAGLTYKVKEIFYTLQGEGAHAGRPAVFCRFAAAICGPGGKPTATSVCKFCDTDFVGTDGEGGGKFADAEALSEAVASKWPVNGGGRPMVVCSGGEPLLQLDVEAIEAFHARGFYVAVETNGTVARRPGSTGSASVQRSGLSSSSTRVTRSSSLSLRAESTLSRLSTWTSRASACSRWTVQTWPRTRN